MRLSWVFSAFAAQGAIVCAPVRCAKHSKANIGVAEIKRTWFLLASAQRVFSHWSYTCKECCVSPSFWRAYGLLYSINHSVAFWKVMKKWLPGKMALFSPSPPSSVWFSRKFGVTRTTELRRLRSVREFFFSFLERATFLCPCAPPPAPETVCTNQSHFQICQGIS